jgi:hypothetical protein
MHGFVFLVGLIFKILLDCVAVPHFAGWQASHPSTLSSGRSVKACLRALDVPQKGGIGKISHTASVDANIN